MHEVDSLIAEAREVLDEMSPGTLTPEGARASARRLAALRERIEGATLHLPGQAAAGYLADATAAMQLARRAAESGDEDRAQESREQADLYLAAAEQALAH